VTEQGELVLDARARLGEGPVWDESRGALWWLDILRGQVHLFDPTAGRDEVKHEFDDEVGMLVLGSDGELLLGVGREIIRVDLDGSRSVVAEAAKGDRFNDGCCDAAGRLFTGTMTADLREGASALYRLDAHGLAEVLPDVTLSNGIDWSPDGRTMYFVDTVLEQVHALDYELATGSLSRRRVLIDLASSPGRPDGLTVDAAGRLWVATARGAAVRCFDPEGQELLVLDFPVEAVTSCTIGGGDLDELWVTTAAMSGTSDPAVASGGLFRVRGLGVAGVPSSRWRSSARIGVM